jgi:UPF0755 protein
MARRPDDAAQQPPLTGGRPPGEGWQRYEPGFGPGGSLGPQNGRGVRSAAARGSGGRRRGRGATGYLLVAVVALIIGAGVGYARGYFSAGKEGAAVTVVVKQGSSLRAIAQLLEQSGVVKHARAFEIRADADGYAARFMPGTYTLHVNEPYGSLVAQLLKGAAPTTVHVVIPEGTTLRQAAEIVSSDVKTISAKAYVRAARDDPPPFKLQGYKKGATLEGMLFPATYDVVPQKTTAAGFVKSQLAAFDAYFAKVDLRRATAANLTAYDVVIIASMIDREVRVASERPLVAAVIWNRLRRHMPLQIDATIDYALGKTKPVLTYNDLKIDSPYNTYTHLGLPPTPISNPGLAALQAAAEPAHVPYLYYVARNDGTGRHYFSDSYQQFLADKAKAAANSQ